MVPGQLSLSLNVSKTKELIVEFRKRQQRPYTQWDPCGEGEQLQVPRCKHLRGPDLDCTHSNTGHLVVAHFQIAQDLWLLWCNMFSHFLIW